MSDYTNTLQSVVNLCSTHLDLIPLAGVNGITNEPALSLCNDAISELLAAPFDWKFNRVEAPMLITAQNKQDYLFAGAAAFTLGSASTGAAIDLASNSAITETGTTVTVNTLEPHRFSIGSTVYMTGNTVGAFNSTFTDNGVTSAWSNGWTITAVPTATSFQFTHTQSGLSASGAPGITDLAWLASASMVEMNNNSSPQNVKQLNTVRELPVWSRVANPEKVAIISDNGNGVVKLRLYYVPGSTVWGVNLVYQAKPTLKVALSDTWAPFPDSYSAVYRQSFLYRCYRYVNSPRADVEYQKLQQQIGKALGANDREESDVTIQPAEPFFFDYYSF